MLFSFVIPAYNEEKNLRGTVLELTDALKKESMDYEIIIVDDASEDETRGVGDALTDEDARVRIVSRMAPSGFGRAIRTGLTEITGDGVIIYMADQSDEPRDAIAYCRKLEEGYDCVFGSRFVRGSRVERYPPVKRFINRLVNRMLQLVFLCPYNDLTNAFKAYRTSVVRVCGPYRASHFNITIEMSLSAVVRNYRIAQIPIAWYGRTWGSSKLSLRTMGRRYLSTLLQQLAQRMLVKDDLMAECHAAEQNPPTAVDDEAASERMDQ
jgi:dolichol-phosphate mannosyltransferase